MQYANIVWQCTDLDDSIAAINWGDQLQLLAIQYLYAQAGIKKENIIDLTMRDIKTYRGGQLLLPINWSVLGDQDFMEGNMLAISPDIKPIFLGLVFSTLPAEDCFNEHNRAYLNKYGPVGCRDEFTCRNLQQRGIHAYVHGCITTILPQEKVTGNKVLLSDVPLSLLEFVPKDILKESVCSTQQEYISTDNIKTKINALAARHYDNLFYDIGLVVTSRLHVAVPGLARGLPVIFARDTVDTRFEFIDRLIPLHTKEGFAQINWKPDPVNYEKVKDLIIRHGVDLLLGRGENKDSSEAIHDFWMSRPRKNYGSYRRSLHHNFDLIFQFMQHCTQSGTKNVKYMLWGITSSTVGVHEEISSRFPQSELVGVIDSFRNVSYHGFTAQRPEAVNFADDIAIIVLSVGATPAAEALFKKRGLPKERYCLQCDRIITQGDVDAFLEL